MTDGAELVRRRPTEGMDVCSDQCETEPMSEVRPTSRWLRVLGRAAAIAALTWCGAVTCVQWFFVVGILMDSKPGTAAAPDAREWFVPLLFGLPVLIGTSFSMLLVIPAWICLWRRRLLTSALFVWVLGLGSVTGMAFVAPTNGYWPHAVRVYVFVTLILVISGLGFVAADPFRVWRLSDEAARDAGAGASGDAQGSIAPEARDGGSRAVAP